MKKRRAVIVDAVNVILRRLARLADSAEVRELLEKAHGRLREVDEWTDRPPTVEERESLMKNVLAVHVEARRFGSWNPLR